MKYYERYVAIGELLDSVPEILKLVHADLCDALESIGREGSGECRVTSDNVLPTVIVQTVEALSLREVVVRVDDSNFLRRFVRIFDGEMMCYSTFCELKNQIQPATWKKINLALAKRAVTEELITSDDLRIDTTAYETNIHHPTDSSLLFDVYRTIAHLVRNAREINPRLP